MAFLDMRISFNADIRSLQNIDVQIARGVLAPAFKRIEEDVKKEFNRVFTERRSDARWPKNSPKYVATDPLKKSNLPLTRTGRLQKTLTTLSGPGLRVRRGPNYLTIRRAGTALNYLNFSLRGRKLKADRKIPKRDPFATMITRKGRIKKPFKQRWEGFLFSEMQSYIRERFSVALTAPRRGRRR